MRKEHWLIISGTQSGMAKRAELDIAMHAQLEGKRRGDIASRETFGEGASADPVLCAKALEQVGLPNTPFVIDQLYRVRGQALLDGRQPVMTYVQARRMGGISRQTIPR